MWLFMLLQHSIRKYVHPSHNALLLLLLLLLNNALLLLLSSYSYVHGSIYNNSRDR